MDNKSIKSHRKTRTQKAAPISVTECEEKIVHSDLVLKSNFAVQTNSTLYAITLSVTFFSYLRCIYDTGIEALPRFCRTLRYLKKKDTPELM